MTKEDSIVSLEWSYQLVYTIEESQFDTIESIIKDAIQKDNRQMGEILWPLRVALSGLEKSPSPFEMISIMGKEETLKRIQYAQNMLRE
jgi:glutamyl-tRNA synthetase